MTEIEEIKYLLKTPKEVVILSHRNPDGDAIGSSFALKYFLESFMHSVKVIFPSEYPPIFDFVHNIDQSIIYDFEQDKAIKTIVKAELIFCLDFNGLDRIDKMGDFVDKSGAKKFLIDHHLDPEPFADFQFSDTTASSTCELIYQFIEDLDEIRKLDKQISETLFIGLITDTGSFRYSTNPRTYKVASILKAFGADDYYIQDKINNSLNEKHLRLLGHCLANRLEVLSEYQTGIIHLNKQDYKDFDIQRGDTEGVVNYIS